MAQNIVKELNQKNYGKNTKEALNAGFVWGYEGLINNIINKIIIFFYLMVFDIFFFIKLKLSVGRNK